MPWMMCEKVYQSVRCCEFSELLTTPCHNLTYPHRQIGTRPIANSTAAAMTMMASAAVNQGQRERGMVSRVYRPRRAAAVSFAVGRSRLIASDTRRGAFHG